MSNGSPGSAQPIQRWLSRAWAGAVDRLRGGQLLGVYAFGKHPAFADFIDVARLPAVPGPFRHFHDVLRTAVERDGGPTEPRLIGWRERGDAAVLWVQPSRDRGDETTGQFRRCPLLLGVTGRAPLADLLAFGGGRLSQLADEVTACEAEGVLERIGRAAAEWPTAWAAGERAASVDGSVGGAIAAVQQAGGAEPILVIVDAARAAVERVGLSTVTAMTLAERLRKREEALDVHPGLRGE